MTTTFSTCQPGQPGLAISSRRAAARPTLRRRINTMVSLARQRRALARLDDSQLADIGLSRAEATAEAARPLWDAPEYWKNIR